MTKEKIEYMDDGLNLFRWFGGAIISLFIIYIIFAFFIFHNSYFVNIEYFGDRACQSQGLQYKGFHWLEGNNNVPVIECTDKKESIMDGVVIKVKE